MYAILSYVLSGEIALKNNHYYNIIIILVRRFIFQPVAVETSGAMGKLAIQFSYDLSRRLVVRFQDERKSNFQFQGVSWLFSEGTCSAFRSHTVIRC